MGAVSSSEELSRAGAAAAAAIKVNPHWLLKMTDGWENDDDERQRDEDPPWIYLAQTSDTSSTGSIHIEPFTAVCPSGTTPQPNVSGKLRRPLADVSSSFFRHWACKRKGLHNFSEIIDYFLPHVKFTQQPPLHLLTKKKLVRPPSCRQRLPVREQAVPSVFWNRLQAVQAPFIVCRFSLLGRCRPSRTVKFIDLFLYTLARVCRFS